MFEEVLSERALEAVNVLASVLKNFYLAGGTGLALSINRCRMRRARRDVRCIYGCGELTGAGNNTHEFQKYA